MADRIGQYLGNYRLVRLLGRGGFAEVYLGEQVNFGAQVAIKILHAQLTNRELERFNAEASTIAHLRHRHIVRLLEFATDQGTPFLVLDYAPGGTLRERHPRGTPVPLPTVLSYVLQACDALHYAHQEKLIHRDVKPENLLLAADGRVLLSDFGIATVAQSSHSQSTQEALGTITYMAPEQIQGKPRPASDLYALGVIAYEWLTGEPPFSGAFGEIATQHLFTPPPPLRERVPALSEAVEYVVLQALAKNPHERFPHMRDFATALEEAAQGKSPLRFASTQITPPTFAALTTPVAPQVSAAEATRVAAPWGAPSPTTPELPPTFTTPPPLAARMPPPTGPVKPRRTPRLLRNALVAVLTLLLIGTSGVALALSHPSLFGSSDASQGGRGSITSSGRSASSPGVGGAATSTATPTAGTNTSGMPTPRPTNTPLPGATATPTATPTPIGPTATPTPTPTATSTPAPTTHAEQEGHYGANTFTNPYNASGMGTKIPAGTWVQVTCKVYAPAIQSANPDGYWYLIASSPWNNAYYAVANTFMNGDPWNGPYTHNTDFSVPNC